MKFGGRLSHDAPDPALETIEKARRMPVPVIGLVPQRHLEDWDAFGVESIGRDDAFDSCAVSISYTLWRNPHNLDDPVNLADLDAGTLAELGQEVPWPRPQWLLERVRRGYYPMLWEAVRTSWYREPQRWSSVEAELAAHVNHLLVNRFRDTRVRAGADGRKLPGELDSPVDERHVEHGVTLRVNGFEREGIRIDTDPDVYGVGVDLGDRGVVTAVIPRDELRFVEIAFATRPL